jgi:hypothetical protein
VRQDETVIRNGLNDLQAYGVHFIVVILPFAATDNHYNIVKSHGDLHGMVTQCVRYIMITVRSIRLIEGSVIAVINYRKAKLQRPPQGYFNTIIQKINTKLGGINHTLGA